MLVAALPVGNKQYQWINTNNQYMHLSPSVIINTLKSCSTQNTQTRSKSPQEDEKKHQTAKQAIVISRHGNKSKHPSCLRRMWFSKLKNLMFHIIETTIYEPRERWKLLLVSRESHTYVL